LGIAISLDQVHRISGNEFIGRPHIARAMLEKGYIKEHAEAFTKDYIGSGGKAYVERFKITPEHAIRLIHEAGGVSVLAHPGYLGDRTALVEDDIAWYVKYGLDGLEVFYSKHTSEQVKYYQGIAQKYHLYITGGSDFHGRQDVLLGNIMLQYKYVENMKGPSKNEL
ncbi:MAG: PHP domain-containing protein, partial [Candidatus Celaenobacter polaris]|nr:PHP domain-containing protein [Candidatus Celaenobacter polaris]